MCRAFVERYFTESCTRRDLKLQNKLISCFTIHVTGTAKLPKGKTMADSPGAETLVARFAVEGDCHQWRQCRSTPCDFENSRRTRPMGAKFML